MFGRKHKRYVECKNCGSKYLPTYDHKCSSSLVVNTVDDVSSIADKANALNVNDANKLSSDCVDSVAVKPSGQYVECDKCGCIYLSSNTHKCETSDVLKKNDETSSKVENITDSKEKSTSTVALVAGMFGGLFAGAAISDSMGGGNLVFIGATIIIGLIIAAVVDAVFGKLDNDE